MPTFVTAEDRAGQRTYELVDADELATEPPDLRCPSRRPRVHLLPPRVHFVPASVGAVEAQGGVSGTP